jgi:hypothetical protein
MKMTKYLAAGMLAVGLSGAASAVELRFTATSTGSGVLGYLDLDSSVLNNTAFQFVDNTNLIDLHFVDPATSAVVNTVGPAGQGTFFDSTGASPTVVGGGGFTGGTAFSNGVWIAGTTFVLLTGSNYNDVVWSSSEVSAVPESSELGLMMAGLSVLAVAARRRRG